MAYDRYDTRRDRDRREDRGFFEKAGDEIASWFGDDEAERRRREDERMNRGRWNRDYDRDRYAYGGWGGDWDRDRYESRGYDRDFDRGRYAYSNYGRDRERNRDQDRGRWSDEQRSYEPMNWTSSDRDYRSGWAGYDRDYSARRGGYERGYGPAYTGGYGREEDRRDYDRGETPWGRDDYRDTSYAGSVRDNDRHYNAWRQRQLDELDRDYDHYCRERQSRFETDFGAWRNQRMSKRRQLDNIREHMDVVGSDGETIGKVDEVRGDQVILTKSDSADNRHHSFDCSLIDTVEGDQVRLDIPAEEAKSRFRDEDRPMFGRDEEKTNLNRSFSGTYES